MNIQRFQRLLDDAWHYVVTAARSRQLGDEATALGYFLAAEERLNQAKVMVEAFKYQKVKFK